MILLVYYLVMVNYSLGVVIVEEIWVLIGVY